MCNIAFKFVGGSKNWPTEESGNTLLEGVCIRHLHNHDMTYVMNMKFYACL